MERFLIVDGIIAAQTPKVADAFNLILLEFESIVEIGFNRGALTLWLHKNKKESTRLVAYDITFDSKQVKNDDIDFRQGNCFSENIINEIKEFITNGGKTLVLCDGGAKEREFSLYSQFLKSGDVIMCHDYSHEINEYNNYSKELGWNSPPESKYEAILPAIKRNRLQPYNYDMFKQVFWGSFIKV